MIFVRFFLTLVCGLCCLAGICQESTTEYEFFGFSDDLRYAAFEVYSGGVIEGEAAYSRIYFVDVDRNEFAVRPLYLADSLSGGLNRVRNAIRRQAEKYFQTYRITGKRLGTKLMLERHVASSRSEAFAFPSQTVKIEKETYQFELIEKPTGKRDMNGKFDEKLLELDMIHNGLTRVLQRDTQASVPTSWGFVIGHHLIDAYKLENKIAVFVTYLSAGFEGHPDYRHMIVTGILN